MKSKEVDRGNEDSRLQVEKKQSVDTDYAEAGNRSFLKSVRIAAWGFRQAVYDRNFKIQLVAAVIVLIAALVLSVGTTELAVLILCIAWVLSLELINTALEKNVDLACDKHYHPLAKAAKDVAAGAVLLASFASVIIGLLILGPPLWQLLFG